MCNAEAPNRRCDGPPAALPRVRACVRVCVCVWARVGVFVCIVLFLYLTAFFGSIQNSSSLHHFCPLRDGGMCDLALNDEGNMVRRQEKKNWRRESHRRHHPLFLRVVVHFPRSCYILDFAISNMCITVFPLWQPPCGFLLDKFQFSFIISFSVSHLYLMAATRWCWPLLLMDACHSASTCSFYTSKKHGAVYLVPLCTAPMSHPSGLRGEIWSKLANSVQCSNLNDVAQRSTKYGASVCIYKQTLVPLLE